MPNEFKPERPLCILHVEDNPADAELIRGFLERGGLSVDMLVVASRVDYLAALGRMQMDLILCDYDLPHFHGLAALELARNLRPEVPFIFVSGFLGDDLAAATLRQGAADYLLKDRLARLVPAVRCALKEAKIKSLVSERPRTGDRDDPGDRAAGRGEES